CRKQLFHLFQKGDYVPLTVRGSKAAHVCSFIRQSGREAVLVAVPRLIATLLSDKKELPIGNDVWGDTRIDLPEADAGSTLRKVFSEESVSVERGGDCAFLQMSVALQYFPVALLHRSP